MTFKSTSRFFLFIVFLSLSFLGYGQQMKLGFRSGASFSNFYAHHAPAEKPRFSFQPDPNKPALGYVPVTNYRPSYYYETAFVDDMRTGFFSYLFLDLELEKRLSAEVGLGYSQKGINIKYTRYATSINADNSRAELSYQFNRNLRLDYLVVPVTIQYKLGRQERFYVLGGVYNAIAVNFLIKESLVATNEQFFDPAGQFSQGSTGNAINGAAYANIFDAGLVGGFGVNIPLANKMMIGIDIRSNVGMVSIPAKYEEQGFQSFKQSTKNINFETGLKIIYPL